MKYLFIILYFQISHKECTIDIDLSHFIYLSDHLTAEECHRLYASLHFITYDLPANIIHAMKKVPKDIPCIKLLLKWNSGQEKWEGKRKTHMEVEHRLRQIGRNDLADWLGTTVFHNLAKEMNNTLSNVSYFEDNKTVVRNKLVTDRDLKNDNDEWTAIDSMLWVIIVGFLGAILLAFGRVLLMTCRRAGVSRKGGEELIDLLSVASVGSDIEETIYEFRVENNADNKHVANDDSNKNVKS